jgi:hypothetical protein
MSTFDHVWGENQRGGPAFPCEIRPYPQNIGAQPKQHPGMDLHAYFAGKAIEGAAYQLCDFAESEWEHMAERYATAANLIATAMLAAREAK